jgi:hypothetical protein
MSRQHADSAGTVRAAADVALRALCLGGLIMRSEYEKVVRDIGVDLVLEIHRGLSAQLDRWLAEERLVEHQSRHERRLFAKPLGSWNEQDSVEVSWRLEALGALSWALHLVPEMPPYDQEFAQAETVRHLGLTRPTANFVRAAHLRPSGEIGRARAVAELWHWRSRTTRVQREGNHPPPPGYTYDQIISIASRAAHDNGDIPPPVREDFPAFGKPYRDLTNAEWSRATSIAMERHFALNWLCGYAADWDRTPTDT